MNNTVKIVLIVIVIIVILFLLFNNNQSCVKQLEVFQGDIKDPGQDLSLLRQADPSLNPRNWQNAVSNVKKNVSENNGWLKNKWNELGQEVDHLGNELSSSLDSYESGNGDLNVDQNVDQNAMNSDGSWTQNVEQGLKNIGGEIETAWTRWTSGSGESVNPNSMAALSGVLGTGAVAAASGNSNGGTKKSTVVNLCDSVIANNSDASSRPVQICKAIFPQRYAKSNTVVPETTVAPTIDGVAVETFAAYQNSSPAVSEYVQNHVSGEYAPWQSEGSNNNVVQPQVQKLNCINFDKVNQCMTACDTNTGCNGFVVNQKNAANGGRCCLINRNGQNGLLQKASQSGLPVFQKLENGGYSSGVGRKQCRQICPKCINGECPGDYRCANMKFDPRTNNTCVVYNNSGYDETAGNVFDSSDVPNLNKTKGLTQYPGYNNIVNGNGSNDGVGTAMTGGVFANAVNGAFESGLNGIMTGTPGSALNSALHGGLNGAMSGNTNFNLSQWLNTNGQNLLSKDNQYLRYLQNQPAPI